ncbi:hypothetical protein K474DRAFT_528476 [Panus rudis PR-1116 ss-1]|nr:hypothetical protein K474DRAFT_528476 [Panus rudis PR-1116 ss-1]
MREGYRSQHPLRLGGELRLEVTTIAQIELSKIDYSQGSGEGKKVPRTSKLFNVLICVCPFSAGVYHNMLTWSAPPGLPWMVASVSVRTLAENATKSHDELSGADL